MYIPDEILLIKNGELALKGLNRRSFEEALMREGIETAMPETIESSFFLGYSVLDHMGVSEHDIDNLLSTMRENDYACLATTISDKRD